MPTSSPTQLSMPCLALLVTGDIGTLFPDHEEIWRGADSIDLLRTVVGTLAGRVINIDATIVCEQPRLAPYRAEIERILG